MAQSHFLAMNPLSRRQVLRYLAACVTPSLLIKPSSAQATATRRVITIGGALTEIVFRLQASADLVGVDSTSIYPDQAKTLPSVGYARQLATEGVLSLAPSHLLVTEEAGPPAVLRQLEASGIRVASLPAKYQFDGLRQRIIGVGTVLERNDSARALVEQLDATWHEVRQQVLTRAHLSASRSIRVMFVLAHSPVQMLVAGSSTAAQAMLNYAGAVNAVQGFNGYRPLTPEGLLAAQPDCLLVTEQGLKAAGGLNTLLELPGLTQTPAGRSQAVITMDALRLLGFGPRMPDAVLALHQDFYAR